MFMLLINMTQEIYNKVVDNYVYALKFPDLI